MVKEARIIDPSTERRIADMPMHTLITLLTLFLLVTPAQAAEVPLDWSPIVTVNGNLCAVGIDRIGGEDAPFLRYAAIAPCIGFVDEGVLRYSGYRGALRFSGLIFTLTAEQFMEAMNEVVGLHPLISSK